MLEKAFFDSETAGLHGVIVKMQWAFDDEDRQMMDAWLEPVSKSMALIERIVKGHVIAHNLRFDWFHVSKWYNMCKWILDNYGNVRPVDLDVEIMVEAEWQSQFGLCLKPAGATCTLLCTQRGELQTLMNRKAVVVKRQPVQLREKLMEKLEKLTAHLPQILFAKREDPFAPRWTWAEIKEEENGEVNEEFVDIRLNFKPSNALKDICEFKLGYAPKFRHTDIHLDNIPAEYKKKGYMPFARLAGPEMWPDVIQSHIDHWAYNEDANEYAADDITLLKALYEHVGSPEPDNYGTLACQIASCRLKGMEVDVDKAAEQLAIQEATIALAPVNVDSPKQVREYLADAMDDIEALIVAKSAKSAILEDICKEYTCEEAEQCGCTSGCPRCDCKHAAKIFQYDLDELRLSPPKKKDDRPDWEAEIKRAEEHIERLLASPKGWIPEGKMPVIARVREIQRTRKAGKNAQVYRKLIECRGRMYPSFNPIGAKSGRLSGADGLNFQAIGSEEMMRSVFTLPARIIPTASTAAPMAVEPRYSELSFFACAESNIPVPAE